MKNEEAILRSRIWFRLSQEVPQGSPRGLLNNLAAIYQMVARSTDQEVRDTLVALSHRFVKLAKMALHEAGAPRDAGKSEIGALFAFLEKEGVRSI